ncbi:hypothetical protein IIY66_00625 [Candidatus Saccharibacteria bacterium]|nr:hypothetical protein [Candidatus Saccharibacteria bacterium]
MDSKQNPQLQYAQTVVPGGMPMVQQVPVVATPQKSASGLIKTIVIVILALVSVTFIGLFIWMFLQYNEVQEDVDYKISLAVAEAKDEQGEQDRIRYENDIKYPLRTFSGPADYGQLTFEYPKTWSVYVESDAANGGDFLAYFNPGQVNTVSKDTINALRVSILDDSYEDVVSKYQRAVDAKDSNLAVQAVTIGNEEKGIQVTANRYTGTIPNTDLSGYIVIFKIRDKTVIMQTDSVLFEADFDALLNTIVFNA